MGALDFVGNNSSSGGVVGAFIRLILRFFQFVLAITVAGLYGVDLHRAREMGAYTDGKWVYAEVVAGLSAVTVLIYGIPFFKSYWAFAWDWILTILWFALFGIFGKIFINANPTPKQGGIIRMKRAVWIDLVNALLWLITAAYATAIFLRSRKGRTTHTGRATV